MDASIAREEEIALRVEVRPLRATERCELVSLRIEEDVLDRVPRSVDLVETTDAHLDRRVVHDAAVDARRIDLESDGGLVAGERRLEPVRRIRVPRTHLHE